MGGVGELKHVGTHVMEGDIFQPDDDQVQRLIIQGAYRPALERLIHSYQHLIVRYCVTMLGDTGYGEEIAQEVFLGAYAAMPRFRQEASVRTWLVAIARKQCLKALRDRRRRRRLEEAQRQAIPGKPIGCRRTQPRRIRRCYGSGCGRASIGWAPRSGRCSCCARDGTDLRRGGAPPGAVRGRCAPAAGAGAAAAAGGA